MIPKLVVSKSDPDPAGFEFLTLARSGSGRIWNSQIWYNSKIFGLSNSADFKTPQWTQGRLIHSLPCFQLRDCLLELDVLLNELNTTCRQSYRNRNRKHSLHQGSAKSGPRDNSGPRVPSIQPAAARLNVKFGPENVPNDERLFSRWAWFSRTDSQRWSALLHSLTRWRRLPLHLTLQSLVL